MSWTNPEGSAIDSPRRPRCRQTDALLEWIRQARGVPGRQARHRAYVAWLLVRVGDLTIREVAVSEGASSRTIEARLAKVREALESLL